MGIQGRTGNVEAEESTNKIKIKLSLLVVILLALVGVAVPAPVALVPILISPLEFIFIFMMILITLLLEIGVVVGGLPAPLPGWSVGSLPANEPLQNLFVLIQIALLVQINIFQILNKLGAFVIAGVAPVEHPQYLLDHGIWIAKLVLY